LLIKQRPRPLAVARPDFDGLKPVIQLQMKFVVIEIGTRELLHCSRGPEYRRLCINDAARIAGAHEASSTVIIISHREIIGRINEADHVPEPIVTGRKGFADRYTRIALRGADNV